jgi:hypothetical protein
MQPDNKAVRPGIQGIADAARHYPFCVRYGCTPLYAAIIGKTVLKVEYPNPVEIIGDGVAGRECDAYAACRIGSSDGNAGQAKKTVLLFLCILAG